MIVEPHAADEHRAARKATRRDGTNFICMCLLKRTHGWDGRSGRTQRVGWAYKSAHLMIFGRPQVGLDAAVSAGGRGRTPALSARQRRRKFWVIFLYSRCSQLPATRPPCRFCQTRFESRNVLSFSLTFPSCPFFYLLATDRTSRGRVRPRIPARSCQAAACALAVANATLPAAAPDA